MPYKDKDKAREASRKSRLKRLEHYKNVNREWKLTHVVQDKRRLAEYLIKSSSRYAYLVRKNKYKFNSDTDISKVEYESMINNGCSYCGEPVVGGKGVGLDRIDSSKPYLINNVLPCCKFCNVAKGTMSISEFVQWVELIHHRINRIGVTLAGPSPTLIRGDVSKDTVGNNQEQWVQDRDKEFRRIQQIHFFN